MRRGHFIKRLATVIIVNIRFMGDDEQTDFILLKEL